MAVMAQAAQISAFASTDRRPGAVNDLLRGGPSIRGAFAFDACSRTPRRYPS
ncbi:MAG: hypothetical protein HRU01_28890 [Myxococcales bacterium]|nr:hypothetical protein [Myxococcales bacterium]